MQTRLPVERIAPRADTFAAALNRAVLSFSRHWLFIFAVIFGIFVGLPWLAPVFMKMGWGWAGDFIYLIYSTQCHQLPQRSFFLFGEQLTYSLPQIQAAWRYTNNPILLRQFIGNEQMGWKVAWSDRMVSMYTSIFFLTLPYYPFRKRLKPIPIWAFVLLLLPIVFDGGTHLLSDLAGIGNGFRDNNQWLALLTANSLPVSFYAGDALGSFNSWMRLITGALMGVALVGLSYPHLESGFSEIADEITRKLQRAGFTI